MQAISVQQLPCMPRVFTGDGVHQTQRIERAQADVGQVTDRCRHDVKGAGWVVLTTRYRLGRHMQGCLCFGVC